MKSLLPRLAVIAHVSTLLLSAACEEASPSEAAPLDASTSPPEGVADAVAATPVVDASTTDAGAREPDVVDGGAIVPKPACTLLSAAEVAAVLGVAQNATELVSGMQCQFASADPERKSVRGLLEIVSNGRAIYEANLRNYSAAGMTALPQSGIGDQAAFVSESAVRSSMMSTRGDLLLRLNLGWGDPGTDSATQLAGERTLMLKALERLEH